MAGSLLLSAAGPLLFSELSLELGPGSLTQSTSYAMLELRDKRHMSRQDATSYFPPIIALCAFKHLRSTDYFDTPRRESQVESPSLTLFEAQLLSQAW